MTTEKTISQQIQDVQNFHYDKIVAMSQKAIYENQKSQERAAEEKTAFNWMKNAGIDVNPFKHSGENDNQVTNKNTESSFKSRAAEIKSRFNHQFRNVVEVIEEQQNNRLAEIIALHRIDSQYNYLG